MRRRFVIMMVFGFSTVGLFADTAFISFSISSPSAQVGQFVQLQVDVFTRTGVMPTGSVTITSNPANASCSDVLAPRGGGSFPGQAEMQCFVGFTAAGSYTMTASYSGDATFTPLAATGTISIVRATPFMLIQRDLADSSVIGVAFPVRVRLQSFVGVPTGVVTIDDGAGASCMMSFTGSSTLNSCDLTSHTAGTRDFTATYGGDAAFAPAVDHVSHQFLKAATTTAITSDAPDPSVAGDSVTVAFDVTSAAGTPTGQVIVTDGLGASCTGTLASGAGSCALTLDPAGDRTLTATYAGDGNFNGSSATEPHVVNQARDTEPPVFVKVAPTPVVLWPPNHKMQEIRFDVTLIDNRDPNPTAQIVSVASNEPDNGLGDGNTSDDIQVTGPLTVMLRAERSGKGSGREYRITLAGTDASGNVATQQVVIRAPQHQ